MRELFIAFFIVGMMTSCSTRPHAIKNNDGTWRVDLRNHPIQADTNYKVFLIESKGVKNHQGYPVYLGKYSRKEYDVNKRI